MSIYHFFFLFSAILLAQTGSLAKMVHQHGDGQHIPDEHRVHRPGGWLPADSRVHLAWLERQIRDARENPKHLFPQLQDFKNFIESTPRAYMWFNAMFEEVPSKKPYFNDPSGQYKLVQNYTHMLEIINHVFTTAPQWTDEAENVGMVGVPMNAILDFPMATPSGYAAFLDPEVNMHLKSILNEWGQVLKTPESAEALSGWFGETGKKDLMQVANNAGGTDFDFADFYVCDPTKKHYGYKSWDDFFTRQVRQGVRPVPEPDNDNVVANACESKTFKVQRNAKLRDQFWIKGQPYSVRDMLAHDPLAEQFGGGTVYQAFLSALSYHRWHSPVSGTVKKAFVQDGTYFSEPLFEDSVVPHNYTVDADGLDHSQGYLTALATRAIIFIEADNPAIGLMAFIGVGMDEVSTCEITVKEGQHIKKGDQTGMFHFGGSTHAVLFRKDVKIEGFPESGQAENVPVRSRLAEIVSK